MTKIVPFAGDFSVRIFDLDTSDSFLLPMKRSNDEAENEEQKPIDNDTKPTTLHRNSIESDDDLLETDSAKLTITTTAASSNSLEVFSCLAYCSDNQTLCAGTNQGRLYMWKRNNTPTIPTKETKEKNAYEYGENYWQLCNISNVRGTIKHCSWGICDISSPCVLLNCVWNVYILKVGKEAILAH